MSFLQKHAFISALSLPWATLGFWSVCLAPKDFIFHGHLRFFLPERIFRAPLELTFIPTALSLGWSEIAWIWIIIFLHALHHLPSQISLLFAVPVYCWMVISLSFSLIFSQAVIVRVRVLEGHLLCSFNGVLNITMCFCTCSNNMLGAVLVQLGKLNFAFDSS